MTVLLRDRYEPIEVVGHGGEGRVLKAIDRQHDRWVALKVRTVHDDVDPSRLLHEARVLLAVAPHPNLPLVREDFFEDDQYVVAMDWIDGTDLDKLLRVQGRPGLAPSTVLRWLADAASALTHLHTQLDPVVHGDVKPSNLVLTTGGRVALVDFGWSSAPGVAGHRGGTLGFSAPELAAGSEPSPASDVYALAATAFTLLTGEPPSGIRPEWTGIDDAARTQLENAIRAGLATDPARRPASAGEFVERLRAGWGSTLPTGVLTFCTTDVVDAPAMWDSDPVGTATALVHHTEQVADIMERHRGRTIHGTPEDGSTLSVFHAALDAVAAAVELQQQLGERAGSDSGGPPISARVALHTGETRPRDGGYVGAALNFSGRVRDLADGGEILTSATTAAAVVYGLAPGTSLVELGPHRLPGSSELHDLFAVSAPGVPAPPPRITCPYPGLPAFEREDADRFFGRQAVVAELVRRLDDGHIVALVGASGSGKSSVLRAGVLAACGGGTICTPGAKPGPVVEGTDLLIVDQLEEAFTLCDDAASRAGFLTSLIERTGPVAVGLRADYYGRFGEHQGFARALARNQILLGPMNDDDLREAIVGPARMGGLRVEPALVDVLLDECRGEPGALPLLSHAMRETWERRDGRTLTFAAYRATGGVRGAIAATAEQVFATFEPATQELARRALLALTEPGDDARDTRRRARLDELTPAGGTGETRKVLEALAEARLVTIDEGGVGIAHEALLQHWPRLREWLDDDRDGRRLERHLISAAAGWEALGRDSAELYRGPRLAAAIDWAEGGALLPQLGAEFLAAGVAEQERGRRAQTRTNRRLRALLVGVGVALVVALVAGAVALVQRRHAGHSRDLADTARVAAVSRSVVERQPDLGMLLAVAAFDYADNADTRDALLNAVATHPLLDGLIYGVESGLEGAVFSPDGTLLATPTSDGTGTILWDTTTHRRIAVLRDGLNLNLNLDAAFSADGRWLAVPAVYLDDQDQPRGRLHVWDVQTRTVVAVVASPAGGLTTAAFSGDGSRLFTQAGITLDGPMHDDVVVWDTRTWTPEPTWTIDDEYVEDGTFTLNADGSIAAQPLTHGTVVAFHTLDRSPLGEPIDVAALTADPTGPVTALAVAPGDGPLAIATEEAGIFVVDATTGELQRRIDVPESAAAAVQFSPDGSLLAAGRLDGRTQIYDVATGEPAGPPLAASVAAITNVSFNADGTRLATTSVDRTGALWRLDGGRTIGVALDGQAGPVTEAAFSPDGTRLVTGSLDGAVAVRDGRSGAVITATKTPGEVLSVTVDPVHARWAAGTTGGVIVSALDSTAGRTLAIGTGWAQQVAFSPDGDTLAVAVDRTAGDLDAHAPAIGEVLFVDPDDGTPNRAPIELDEPLFGVAYSPDGTIVAVLAVNNLVHLYNVADGVEIDPPIDNPDAQITAMAFSPDGTRLAVGITTGALRQYDVATHAPVGEQLGADPNGVFGVAYSPDGSVLAGTSLGFSTTQLWDARTGAALGTRLTGGRVPYSYRTFTVDHLMASRPAFSPTGDRLAAPGFTGASVIWDLDPQQWRGAACAIGGRDLTPEEWERYLPTRDPHALCPAVVTD